MSDFTTALSKEQKAAAQTLGVDLKAWSQAIDDGANGWIQEAFSRTQQSLITLESQAASVDPVATQNAENAFAAQLQSIIGGK